MSSDGEGKDKQPNEFDYLEVGDRPRVPPQPDPRDDEPQTEDKHQPPPGEADVSDELVLSGLAVPCVSCGENVILGPAEIPTCPHCGFTFETPLKPGKFTGLDLEVPPEGPIPEPPTMLGRGSERTFMRLFGGPGSRVLFWQAVLFALIAAALFVFLRNDDGALIWREWVIVLVSAFISLILTQGTARRFGAIRYRLTPFDLTARWLSYSGRVRMKDVTRVESWVVIRMRRNPLNLIEDLIFSSGRRYKRFDVKTRFSGGGAHVVLSTYSLGYERWLQLCREGLHFAARHNPAVEVDLNTLTLLGYRQQGESGAPSWEDPDETGAAPPV